ncbi:MAG: hypothetical protein NC180_12960 [Muribaculaceae bacterium]|nr:hypothetical protein [Muribaculaceae bacterium]
MFSQQNMGAQSREFMELLHYVAGMQLQLDVMANEMQGMREQLSQLQENQPKTATKGIMDKIKTIQGKLADLSECLSEIKDHLITTAAKSVNTFKEKGKEEMFKALQKGISVVKSMLVGYQEQLVDSKMDCEKTANQIDSIGDELKQIGNSAANVGRLLAGKGTKEVSADKPGVGVTRAFSSPVKNVAARIQKVIDTIDCMMEKLDKLSERFRTEKEAEKGERASIKDKLSKMQEKTGQQKKAPEPDKAKSKAECL